MRQVSLAHAPAYARLTILPNIFFEIKVPTRSRAEFFSLSVAGRTGQRRWQIDKIQGFPFMLQAANVVFERFGARALRAPTPRDLMIIF